ncbi:hypothetical protein PspLS_03902 [Pyricularia sp. CBS 133598]|nr:hypothetical protein PspLS_03902 [Pyricularia sp. CBS 133598]
MNGTPGMAANKGSVTMQYEQDLFPYSPQDSSICGRIRTFCYVTLGHAIIKGVPRITRELPTW